MHNRCYMCKEEEETSDNILLHCSKARILWQLIFALFDVRWVMNSLVRRLIELRRFFRWLKKKEKGLENCFFMPFLDHLEGEK